LKDVNFYFSLVRYAELDIHRKISQALIQYGYKSKTVSISHLAEAQEAVDRLVRIGLVNSQLSEEWHFYKRTNDSLPEAKTIIIVAMPEMVTRVRFEWQGTSYPADISPNFYYKKDESNAEQALNNVLAPAGYKTVKASLALKTLAVRSGLAEYGRNNITYIDGMGSYYRLAAFYTDFPCQEDSWGEYEMMGVCEGCSLCRENCPTGSIRPDRFLIHAENCLGRLNERQPDFPFWVRLQPDWPGAFIGCMRCQSVCPANEPYHDRVAPGPSFSEEETGWILDATPLEGLSWDTLQKLDNPDGGLYRLLPGNLSALIEKQKMKE
jgi:epoxyqueuosine reductase